MNIVKHETLYTLTEVATILKVSRVSVWRWCRDGLVEHIILPHGQLRIPQSELDKLTELRRIQISNK